MIFCRQDGSCYNSDTGAIVSTGNIASVPFTSTTGTIYSSVPIAQAGTLTLQPEKPKAPKEPLMSYGPEVLMLIVGTVSYLAICTLFVWCMESKFNIKKLKPFEGWFISCGALLGSAAFIALLAFFYGLAFLLRGF